MSLKKFDETKKGTFSYWFNHWKAYNLYALEREVWKPKYLLHDAEKPWLKLIMPYEKVREIHKAKNRHHLGYMGNKGFDYDAMIIDWEVSRFTKKAAPLNAIQTLDMMKARGRVKAKDIRELVNSIDRIIRDYAVSIEVTDENRDYVTRNITIKDIYKDKTGYFVFLHRKDGRLVDGGLSDESRGNLLREIEVFGEIERRCFIKYRR